MPLWIPVASLDDLPVGGLLRVVVQGKGVVLARTAERVYACQGTCPHEMADLGAGRLDGRHLACPRHRARFDLEDGSVSAGWGVPKLQLYRVEVANGVVHVDGDAVTRAAGGSRKIWDLTGRET